MKKLNEVHSEKLAELAAARHKYNVMMIELRDLRKTALIASPELASKYNVGMFALRVERFHVEHLAEEARQLGRELAQAELAALREEMGF